MARIRTVKPGHWNDRQLPMISLQAHLTWIGTWNFADDDGIFENDPHLIRSQIYPRRKDISIEMVTAWLSELEVQHFIVPFDFEGVPYYSIRTFKQHQKIDRPQPSKIPISELRRIFAELSTNVQGTISPVLYSNVEESKGIGDGKNLSGEAVPQSSDFINNDFKELQVPGSNAKKADQDAPPPATRKKKFQKPALHQLKTYFREYAGNPKKRCSWMPDQCDNEALKMYLHYEANGWVQGKGKPIVNWQATAAQWIIRQIDGTFSNTNTKQQQAPAAVPAANPVPRITKLQRDINYHFERYCENADFCTVISVDASEWDEISKAGLYELGEDDKQKVRDAANQYLIEKSYPATAENQKNYAKKFAVIDFFKRHQSQGNTAVFQ